MRIRSMGRRVSLVLLMALPFLVSQAAWADGTTVRVIMQKHPAVDVLQQMIPDFEKQTGLAVELTEIPQDQMNTKVQLSLASGTDDYDVVMLDDMRLGQFKSADWVVSLKPYLSDPAWTDAKKFAYDDFLKGFVASASIGGEPFALPFYGESSFLMYNKDMFAKAGIKAPPATFAELEKDAKLLTKKSANQFGIAMRGQRSINWYMWSGFAYGMGGGWFDASGKPILDKAETVKATDLYGRLLREYGPPGAANFDWNDVQVAMQQGTVAMIIDATNFAPRLEDPTQSKVVGKVGYAMVPAGPSGAFPSIYSAIISIPKTSPNKRAAWEFLKWVTSSQVQLKSALSVGRLDVTRRSVWQDPAFIKKYNTGGGIIAAATSAFDKAIGEYLPRATQFGDVANEIGIAISSVIAGQDAAQAMKSAQDRVVKALPDGIVTY
jgi:multiple sugar transport system substrate-binding protein